MVDAPLLDRWPGTDQAIPMRSTSRQPPKPVTEAEAIRLAQAGDAAAFEFL